MAWVRTESITTHDKDGKPSSSLSKIANVVCRLAPLTPFGLLFASLPDRISGFAQHQLARLPQLEKQCPAPTLPIAVTEQQAPEPRIEAEIHAAV